MSPSDTKMHVSAFAVFYCLGRMHFTDILFATQQRQAAHDSVLGLLQFGWSIPFWGRLCQGEVLRSFVQDESRLRTSVAYRSALLLSKR